MGSARWCRPRITFFSTSCLARAPVPSPWRAPIPSAVYTATTNANGVPTVSRGFSPDPRNVVGGFANHSRSLRELPRENFRAGHDAVVIGSRRQAPGARPNPEPHAFETWRKPLVLNVLCALFRSVWHQCAPSVPPVCPCAPSVASVAVSWHQCRPSVDRVEVSVTGVVGGGRCALRLRGSAGKSGRRRTGHFYQCSRAVPAAGADLPSHHFSLASGATARTKHQILRRADGSGYMCVQKRGSTKFPNAGRRSCSVQVGQSEPSHLVEAGGIEPPSARV